MNTEATFNNGLFTIPRALQSDEGEYYCKGTNVAGMSEIRTILFVQRGDYTAQWKRALVDDVTRVLHIYPIKHLALQ